MRTTESKTTSRLIVAGAVVAAVLALALALWGCAPNATGATTDQKGDDKATEETATSASVYPNFTEKAAGLFPDTYFNRDMLNTGNRGCNACHENLFDKMVNKEGLTHILSYVGYEKDGTYKLRAMPSGPYDVDRPVLGRCHPRESLRQPAVR